jgi:ABC-type transporter Mla MlaB component
MRAVGSRLQIAVSGRGKVRRLGVSGAVDATTVRELAAHVWTEGGPDAETIVLDLTAVTSIDVRALAALFALKDLMGRTLRVEAARDRDHIATTGRHDRARPRSGVRAGSRV